jgi:hypothetical protein
MLKPHEKAIGSGDFVTGGIAKCAVLGPQAELPVTDGALNAVGTSLWRIVVAPF